MARNEIFEFEQYAEIVLYDKNEEEKARTTIDTEDVRRCKHLRWSLVNGYACNVKQSLYLHQLILRKTPRGKEIDHVNGNTLDNRKSNLRFATHKQNLSNGRLRSNNKSGYKGVRWDKERKKWAAQITVNYKNTFLGRYDSLNDAAEAYKKAALKHFGCFARLK